jgi:thioredoxin reductase (NADPH)
VYGPAADLLGHARFLRAYSAQMALLPVDRDLGHEALEDAAALEATVYSAGGRLGFDGRRCHWRSADGEVAEFDSVYPYLGYVGRNAVLAGVDLAANGHGELEVDRYQQSGLPGLYAIGDVVSGLNQISVAVGQAAIAATHAHNQLPFVPR